MNYNQILLSSFLLFLFVTLVSSHAGLTYPPARNVVGTVGWGDCTDLYCKKEYNWMSLNKGPHGPGAWGDDSNICGDAAYIAPMPQPVATYTAGGDIDITISVTAPHYGYYEFRLCVPDQVSQMPPDTNTAVRRCVEAGPLLKRKVPLAAGETSYYVGGFTTTWNQLQSETRWRQRPEDGRVVSQLRNSPSYQLTYVLPSNVQCEHCILHWYWQTTNSYQHGTATTLDTTEGERFWNCADIAINNPSAKASGITSGIVGGSNSNPPPSNPPPSNPPPSNPPPSNPPPSNPNPNPNPWPNPVPNPNPNPWTNPPSSGSASCSQVKASGSEWWMSVIVPKGVTSLSIQCNGSPNRQCTWDAGWGRFTCSFNGRCLAPRYAVIGDTKCAISTLSSATEADGLDETEIEKDGDDVDAEDDADDSIPGWAIGLFVVGSLSIFTLFVILLMMLRSQKVESV